MTVPLDELAKIHDDHHRLGLGDQRVLDLYRTMLLARRVDDRMWALNRQARAPFVVSSSGHEATQVASVFALDREVDWILPYYRDVGVVLAWGFTPLELFCGVFSKADDPSSGGRQMPNHWSSVERRIFSHSSPIATQYPHATGIAHGLRITNRPGVVVVYGGEGSTSAGDWHEALNYAGIHELPVIFITENNHYAISVPETEEVAGHIADRALGYGVHGVSINGNNPLEVYDTMLDAVARARDGNGPTLIEAQTYRYYAHTSDDDDKLYRTREEVEFWRRRDPVEILKQYLIEARLLPEDLEGSIDEDVTQEVSTAVRAAESGADPDDPYSFVYAREVEPGPAATTPEPATVGDEVTLVAALNQGLHEIFAAHPDVVTLGEDVADPKGGVFKVTQGLSDQFGESRSFNAPLAESQIVGAAIGMAATGLKVIAEIQFADFIHPAFDQIVSEAARIHYRTNGTWTCPIVIRAPYGGGIHGALYHSQSIEAFYTHVPGLKVVVPSTPADAKGLLWEAVEDPDPVLFLEPKKLYRLRKGPYPSGPHRVPFGRAAIRSLGDDLTILAYGAMSYFAEEAIAVLAERGVAAELIDLRSLKPLDFPTIAASIRKTSRVLIVHEDNEFMGFGAELAAQIAAKTFEWLDAPIERYAAPEIPTFPFAGPLEAMVLPNTEGIVERALSLVAY